MRDRLMQGLCTYLQRASRCCAGSSQHQDALAFAVFQVDGAVDEVEGPPHPEHHLAACSRREAVAHGSCQGTSCEVHASACMKQHCWPLMQLQAKGLVSSSSSMLQGICDAIKSCNPVAAAAPDQALPCLRSSVEGQAPYLPICPSWLVRCRGLVNK